uniref:Uncharacterized protein n=1 Tax=Trichuris muris TaxID=70415 RepID=A0A5S6QD37_TRIMR
MRYPNFKSICYAIRSRLEDEAGIKVSPSQGKHAWLRHGCRQNARMYQARNCGNGRMPSYYFDHNVMIHAAVETLRRPHIVKCHKDNCPQGYGKWALDPNRGVLRRRTVYLREFMYPIGRAGEYSSDDSEYGQELTWCGVVVDDDIGLVTTYPAESCEEFKGWCACPSEYRGSSEATMAKDVGRERHSSRGLRTGRSYSRTKRREKVHCKRCGHRRRTGSYRHK